MRLVLATLSLALLAAPISAGETPWQEVAPGVKLRLISSGLIKPDGSTLLGLEIDMPETTKTYWRVPGDTGIPPDFDFAGSTGVVSHEIAWPYPELQQSKDYLDYVYFGPVVLPLKVAVGQGKPQVELNAVLGVCSDICIPAQAKFSLLLDDSAPDRPNGLRIRQAMASVPVEWSQANEPIGAVHYDAEAKLLSVEVEDPAIDPASLIAATDSGEPLFGAPQKSPESDLVLIPVLGKSDQIHLENQTVQLTFLTDMGAFEVDRAIQVSPAE